MYNYCTLFDSNYLTRGLAMYESLRKHSDTFHLYIFAFDDLSYKMLKRLNLDSVTVVSLEELEDEELLSAKEGRSAGEYCWTCTPSTIKYCIEHYSLESCTYLDADLYFYNDPSVLIEEMKDKSVLITPHRYTPEYDQSATSGIYCVQFMTFKNDKRGMEVLDWWRNACNAWCYARFEDGKFGDQKYLDDWAERFEGIHVLAHLGGGMAPWNIQQYRLGELDFDIIFYHFHNFKFRYNNTVEFGGYRLSRRDLEFFYIPYIKHLLKISQNLKEIDSRNDYNGIVKKKPLHRKDPLKFIGRKIKGTYNIYSIEKLIGSMKAVL